MMKYIFLLALLVIGNAEKEVTVPTSCDGLEDGKYIMKLIDDESYPLINIECSAGYILFNPSLQPNDETWQKYLTSLNRLHQEVYGAGRDDRVNWATWFKPTKLLVGDDQLNEQGQDIHFLISPKCDICDADDDWNSHYPLDTAYYANSEGYGNFLDVRRPSCDMSLETLECYWCENIWDYDAMHDWMGNGKVFINQHGHIRTDQENFAWMAKHNVAIGNCLSEINSGFNYPANNWEEYAWHKSIKQFKPTIGTNNRYCQCIKYENKEIKVSKEEYDNFKTLHKEVKEEESGSKDDKYYLYQKDFELGTYRILKPGTYIIMEDIEFNFNPAPSDYESPNDPETDYWWPPIQEYGDEILSKYPGSGYKATDPFMLGFFAGITIETKKGVVLDLNGFTLKQSKQMFYQQPFFSIIELESQPFLTHQGSGNFGGTPDFAENVEIKNGILGRSSHHGIHGNQNKNVYIHDIKIKEFMTHGIQINGYDNLRIEDIEVGPSTDIAFLNHNYAQTRLLLPYMKKIADHYPDETVQFDPTWRKDKGRKYTMHDLIDILVPKLDRVYKYVMSDKFDRDEFSSLIETDEDFKIFGANPSGVSYGAAVYGIYLNYEGAGIFEWNTNWKISTNAFLKNIYIHDLTHEAIEVPQLVHEPTHPLVNSLQAPINTIDIFGGKQLLLRWVKHYLAHPEDPNMPDPENKDKPKTYNPHYVGNIVTDIWFAMNYFGTRKFDEWWVSSPYMPCLVPWATEIEGDGPGHECLRHELHDRFYVNINGDGMIHLGKGLLPLRIVNGYNVNFDGNIRIENMRDYTPESWDDVYHAQPFVEPKEHSARSQQPPYQRGYSMNQMFGINFDLSHVNFNENLKLEINNLNSDTGRVFGIAAWYETKIKFGKNVDISINNVYASPNLNKHKWPYVSGGNRQSEGCGFFVFDAVDPEHKHEFIFEDESTFHIYQSCIYGNTECWGDDTGYSYLGEIDLNPETQCLLYPVDKPSDLASDTTTDTILGQWGKWEQLQFYNNSIHIYFLIAIVIITTSVVYYIKSKNDPSKYITIN